MVTKDPFHLERAAIGKPEVPPPPDAVFAFGPDHGYFMRIGKQQSHYNIPLGLYQELEELRTIQHVYCLSILGEDDFLVTYRDCNGVLTLWSTVPHASNIFFHKFINDHSSSSSLSPSAGFLENLAFNISPHKYEFFATSAITTPSAYNNSNNDVTTDEEEVENDENDENDFRGFKFPFSPPPPPPDPIPPPPPTTTRPTSLYSVDVESNPLRITRHVRSHRLHDGVLNTVLQRLSGCDPRGFSESGYIPGFRPMQVCLGVGKAFLVLCSDGYCVYDAKILQKSYPRLLEDLTVAEHVGKKIAYVSLSGFDGDEHFLLFENRTAKYSVHGSVRVDVTRVAGLGLQAYVEESTAEGISVEGLAMYDAAANAAAASASLGKDGGGGDCVVSVPKDATEHWSRLEALGIRRDGVWRSDIQGDAFVYREGLQ